MSIATEILVAWTQFGAVDGRLEKRWMFDVTNDNGHWTVHNIAPRFLFLFTICCIG